MLNLLLVIEQWPKNEPVTFMKKLFSKCTVLCWRQSLDKKMIKPWLSLQFDTCVQKCEYFTKLRAINAYFIIENPIRVLWFDLKQGTRGWGRGAGNKGCEKCRGTGKRGAFKGSLTAPVSLSSPCPASRVGQRVSFFVTWFRLVWFQAVCDKLDFVQDNDKFKLSKFQFVGSTSLILLLPYSL